MTTSTLHPLLALHGPTATGALVFEFAVTGSTAALSSAWEHFEGMRLLMRATGVPGLVSRAVFAPGTGPGGSRYHNSTVPGLEGYTWNGDASSDEVRSPPGRRGGGCLNRK